ncbi:hypothetical protein HJ030_04265 [Vibrio parahaemolyticus]|nr:hypothetical protein [Vibrio parahaemolyticus]MBE4382372.1 hypothetical protein [Vibrio parahaemolyticus]MBE4404810.1 hypothetical protein [Vibrio parahaemolyticus]
MIKIIESAAFSFPKNEDVSNADAILAPRIVHGELLLAVADGVGSYLGSDLASMTAIEYLPTAENLDVLTSGQHVFKGILSEVVNLSGYNVEYEKASTTLTYLVTLGRELYVAHIGDCRAYIQNGKKLVQITKDHTKHQQLLDHKVFTKKALKNVKGKNVITTAISPVAEMRPDCFRVSLSDYADDNGNVTLFLMSDGAHEYWDRNPRFSPNTMSSVVKFTNSLQRRIERAGPKDDYSLVAVKFQM